MAVFTWALIIVGLYLLIHGGLVLTSKRTDDQGRRSDKLGCGFVTFAAIVWGWALARLLGDVSDGMCLGAASALFLGSLVSLMRRRRIVSAAVMLGAAVLLAVPAMPALKDILTPPPPPPPKTLVDDVAAQLSAIERRIEDTGALVHKRTRERDSLKAKIKELGHAEFTAIVNDKKGFSLLKELAELDRDIAAKKVTIKALRGERERMEVALRRVRRLVEDARAAGDKPGRAEVDGILAEARTPPPERKPATVEEHVAREQLKKLFEEEF